MTTRQQLEKVARVGRRFSDYFEPVDEVEASFQILGELKTRNAEIGEHQCIRATLYKVQNKTRNLIRSINVISSVKGAP